MIDNRLPLRPRRLVAVGGICTTSIYAVDAVPAVPGKVIADRACQVVDGMAVSAACAFVRLGGRADIWGRVGDDPRGGAMRDELAAAGLDVSALRVIPGGVSSIAVAIIDSRGDRLVVPYHDASLDPCPNWLPLETLAATDFVHVDTRWPDGAAAALVAAGRRGIPGMLDADVAPREVLARLVPLASHAVFSDAGLFLHTGCDDLEEALYRVAASHSGHVGATCGAEGYVWLEAGRLRRVPAPAIEPIDTLSAGDVFHGALALALAEGRSLESAARFAVVAASLKCTRFGGRLGCPTRSEVEAAGG
ncbi:MAG: sugar kinase [Planctomycetota bacterium]|nr:MAG: sugar kinase [Planctomycetota bacterium]